MVAKSLSEPSTPKASAESLPPRLLQLLPVGTKSTGQDSHLLEYSAFARRTNPQNYITMAFLIAGKLKHLPENPFGRL